MKTIRINATQLRKGDIVHFHGARFEIATEVTSCRGSDDYLNLLDGHGPGRTSTCIGRWIDGKVVPGYFGPDSDWMFQGNHRAVVNIEPRA